MSCTCLFGLVMDSKVIVYGRLYFCYKSYCFSYARITIFCLKTIHSDMCHNGVYNVSREREMSG